MPHALTAIRTVFQKREKHKSRGMKLSVLEKEVIFQMVWFFSLCMEKSSLGNRINMLSFMYIWIVSSRKHNCLVKSFNFQDNSKEYKILPEK